MIILLNAVNKAVNYWASHIEFWRGFPLNLIYEASRWGHRMETTPWSETQGKCEVRNKAGVGPGVAIRNVCPESIQ